MKERPVREATAADPSEDSAGGGEASGGSAGSGASFIIDCSIAMAWCFGDAATPDTLALQDRLVNESALAPALWFLEVANELAMAEKRKRITAAKSDEFLRLLGMLEIEVDHDAAERAFDRILPLARKHRLTSYDAAYLELALRRGLPLATRDEGLAAAAKKAGVQLV